MTHGCHPQSRKAGAEVWQGCFLLDANKECGSWPVLDGEGVMSQPQQGPQQRRDAEGSRGGGGFYYFSALALRLAAREGSVMVAVATGRLPDNARAGPGRRCRVTGPRGSAAPLPR